MVKYCHAGKGRRVIESDGSESEPDSMANPCTAGSDVHPSLIDPMLGPQPAATGTGSGTLDVTGTYENPRVNIEGDSRIEKDNQLKTALRGGRYGRVSCF